MNRAFGADAERLHPPRAEAEPQLHRLDLRVVWWWRAHGFAGVLGAVALLALLVRWLPVGGVPPSVWILLGGFGFAAAWVGPVVRYRGWSFQVDERELRIRRGVWSRTTSVVPLGRIQHVDTRQDLVERWLGLARVVVFTAGIRGAEIPIPGLAVRDADALRDRLAIRGGVDDAV